MSKRIGSKADNGGIARLRDRRWTAQDAAEVLAAWQASGSSMAAFAREHALTAQRIAWWRRRLGQARRPAAKPQVTATRVRLVPAVVRESAAASRDALVTIRVRRAIAVEIADPALVPVQWLGSLLRECGE